MRPSKLILILGSAPDAVRASAWARWPFDRIVAINNAWRLRPDWDHLVHPEDFPPERRPDRLRPGQSVHGAEDYVPAHDAYGGIVYAGGTMAFTAAYWALARLRPRVLAFLGCDMRYPAGRRTHFYGTGAADPLRPDPTLQSLPAKSARLQILAAAQGCACVNLSELDESAQVFPRITRAALAAGLPQLPEFDPDAVAAARAREAQAGLICPTGDYWNHLPDSAAPVLAEIDALWLRAHRRAAVAA